jgi:hypothetical protein
VADRVAWSVLGKLLEVGAFAALHLRLDADVGQSPVGGQPGVARDGRKVREHRTRFVRTDAPLQLEAAAQALHAHVGRFEYDTAAAARLHGVAQLRLGVRAQVGGDGQALRIEVGVGMVE